jgi:RNA polymerase sigma-70 factor, ECF subfamily
MVAQTSPVASAASPIPVSAEAFGELANPYRRELLVHCYRMLGSVDDAEDAVQDALVRAWHGRNTFQRQVSFRAWLYRIATNACLDAIERRKRGHVGVERLGVEPFATDILEDTAPGPEARYDALESISLAFLTALQVLPARQRAVLILRDVLSWRAAEVAELLELSVPAVNSALHRARTTVSRHYRGGGGTVDRAHAGDPGHLRSLLERYVEAWEAADVAGLVALLRDDAVLSMPPEPHVTGAREIGAFLGQTLLTYPWRTRLLPIHANGDAAFVVYVRTVADAPLSAVAILVLDFDGSRVARMDASFDPRVVARFALPEVYPG